MIRRVDGRSRAGKLQANPGLVERLDAHAASRNHGPGLRRLFALAEVPGPGRADLGAQGILSGQRGVRLPRPVAGRGEPDLGRPALARRQILLHRRQQFLEGDVVHWFFRLQDGRTGFAARSHASDNLLWLGWAAAEYVRMTGDRSILDEARAVPDGRDAAAAAAAGKRGMGFFPLRSAVEEPLLRPRFAGHRPGAGDIAWGPTACR